ncbi:MAG: RNA polymerase sigma factor [Planctomycetota bacterium]
MPDPALWDKEYGVRLLRFAKSRLSDPQLAENAVQDTFVAALRRSSEFRGESEFITWMFSILKRKIIDTHRSLARQKKAMLTLGQRRIDVGNENKRQVDFLEQQESFDQLREVIGSLPKRQAQAIYLFYFEGLSCDIIGDRLDISRSNVWITLHRAKARMLKLLPQN